MYLEVGLALGVRVLMGGLVQALGDGVLPDVHLLFVGWEGGSGWVGRSGWVGGWEERVLLCT